MQGRRFDVFLSYNHADGEAVEGIARRLARRFGDPAIVTPCSFCSAPSAFGDTPDTRDTNQFMADWFVTKRTSVMVGATILALGLLASSGSSERWPAGWSGPATGTRERWRRDRRRLPSL
jgi:hypothetical protein